MYSDHASPTRLTSTPALEPVEPILGGRTRIREFLFQKVTSVEASVDGLSLDVSFISMELEDQAYFMKIMTDIRQDFKLKFALPSSSALLISTRKGDSHLSHHKLLIQSLLTCQHQHPSALCSKKPRAQTSIPFLPIRFSSYQIGTPDLFRFLARVCHFRMWFEVTWH